MAKVSFSLCELPIGWELQEEKSLRPISLGSRAPGPHLSPPPGQGIREEGKVNSVLHLSDRITHVEWAEPGNQRRGPNTGNNRFPRQPANPEPALRLPGRTALEPSLGP